MPNCFQLISKETGKSDSFCDIDNAICAHFGWPVDTVKWVKGWYNVIGLGLAMGKSFEELRVYLTSFGDEQDMLKILDWLNERYTSNSWHER